MLLALLLLLVLVLLLMLLMLLLLLVVLMLLSDLVVPVSQISCGGASETSGFRRKLTLPGGLRNRHRRELLVGRVGEMGCCCGGGRSRKLMVRLWRSGSGTGARVVCDRGRHKRVELVLLCRSRMHQVDRFMVLVFLLPLLVGCDCKKVVTLLAFLVLEVLAHGEGRGRSGGVLLRVEL